MISRDHSDLSENRFCTPKSHGTSSLRALLPDFNHTNIIVLVLYGYIMLYHVISHYMPVMLCPTLCPHMRLGP